MPPIQKNSIVPEKQASKVGDTLEIILMAPLKSDFFASTTEIKVSPTNHHWNCGSITSLSSPFLPISSRWSWEGGGLCGGEVQLEVAWPWVWVSKLVSFDCLDVDLNNSKCIINQLSNFSDFPWIHLFYLRHFTLLTEDFMSGQLENNRIWGLLFKDLKQPSGKQLAEKNPKLGNFEK